MDRVVKDLKAYWDRNAEKYGDTPRALDWGSWESQRMRFEVLSRILPDGYSGSVLDVGCGLGDLYGYLTGRWEIQYLGIDISEKMLEIAKKKYPEVTFKLHDMTKKLDMKFGYVLLSGSLNKRISLDPVDQYKWTETILRNMWGSCKIGMTFNMLSTYADSVAEDDFQYSPERIFKFAQTLSRKVKLDHSYMPHDFTIYIFREDLH